MRIKLEKIIKCNVTVTLKTGLHIGAGNDEIKIGGMDRPVIRDHEGNPYIPGSSLKGRMRMLLELASGLVTGKDELQYKTLEALMNNGELSQEELNEGINILKLFGSSGSDEIGEQLKEAVGIKVSRGLFKDFFLSEEKVQDEITEEKAEVKINRITGTGENPRHTERVKPETEFKGEIILRVFTGDNEKELLKLIEKGFKLIELNGLGGSSSRGYGFVEFKYDYEEVFNSLNR